MIRCAQCALLMVCTFASATWAAEAENQQSWMSSAGYGLFIHYQVFGVDKLTPDEFDASVDSFNVAHFVDQVQRTGASYVIFTLGQNAGYYCAPNATYDRLLGGEPGRKTARRDLPMELGQALKAKGVRLVLYLPSRAPQRDAEAMAALGDVEQTLPAPQEFIKNWSDVCREWSLRYGELVSGWWLDGYIAPAGWADLDAEHNWKTWTDAVRAGNPNAELAFNLGSRPQFRFQRANPAQTFTAGDTGGLTETPQTHPPADGLQWHAATFLGRKWGYWSKQPRFDSQTLLRYIDTINSQGGCLTLDVRTLADGTIQPVLLDALLPLGGQRAALTNGRLDEQLQGAP